MALTHVVQWEKDGWKYVDLAKAVEAYPYHTVSAGSNHFKCALCGQGVTLTKPGEYARHFRHDSSQVDKQCEDRSEQLSGYTSITIENHPLPFRIRLEGKDVSFEIGFLLPLGVKTHEYKKQSITEQIIIEESGYKGKIYRYNVTRLVSNAITYLNVGVIPKSSYHVSFSGDNALLKRYFSKYVLGVPSKGCFFDCRTGQILSEGAKVQIGRDYYWLSDHRIFEQSGKYTLQLVQTLEEPYHSTWFLYKISPLVLEKGLAQMFLEYGLFLTEGKVNLYAVWPPCIQKEQFIYHNTDRLLMFAEGGENVSLTGFPRYFVTENDLSKGGQVVAVTTSAKQQLLALGSFGVLGCKYLSRESLKITADVPVVTILDIERTAIQGEVCHKIPVRKTLIVQVPYDGWICIQTEKEKNKFILKAGVDFVWESICFGQKISLYQGLDCVRSLVFEKEELENNLEDIDEMLLYQLERCGGDLVELPHRWGAIANKMEDYPRTKQWLHRAMKKRVMPRQAQKLLIQHFQKDVKR